MQLLVNAGSCIFSQGPARRGFSAVGGSVVRAVAWLCGALLHPIPHRFLQRARHAAHWNDGLYGQLVLQRYEGFAVVA
jgi:hypothetical protein